MRPLLTSLLVAFSLIFSAGALAADSTTSGKLAIDPPTLIALGFAWTIDGDDNRNAKVTVEYRREGDLRWSNGLDLLRTQNEEMFLRGAYQLTLGNLFAGSLFDLAEDTPYQVRLTLSDPDGVTGESVREITIRTRAEPKPADGRVFHVYPPGFTGTREQPAFSGLLEAYYMASLGGDWSRASPPRVRAGDVIKMHAGVYLSASRPVARLPGTARTTSPRTARRNGPYPSWQLAMGRSFSTAPTIPCCST